MGGRRQGRGGLGGGVVQRCGKSQRKRKAWEDEVLWELPRPFAAPIITMLFLSSVSFPRPLSETRRSPRGDYRARLRASHEGLLRRRSLLTQTLLFCQRKVRRASEHLMQAKSHFYDDSTPPPSFYSNPRSRHPASIDFLIHFWATSFWNLMIFSSSFNHVLPGEVVQSYDRRCNEASCLSEVDVTCCLSSWCGVLGSFGWWQPWRERERKKELIHSI